MPGFEICLEVAWVTCWWYWGLPTRCSLPLPQESWAVGLIAHERNCYSWHLAFQLLRVLFAPLFALVLSFQDCIVNPGYLKIYLISLDYPSSLPPSPSLCVHTCMCKHMLPYSCSYTCVEVKEQLWMPFLRHYPCTPSTPFLDKVSH